MSASDLSEIELYRDDTSGRIVAVDPATGDRYPVPLEQLSVGGEGPIQGVDSSALDSNNRITGGSVDGLTNPLEQNLDANGKNITNAGSVSTEVLNNADIANATVGTVPTSQGDGTLSMSAVSGGGYDVIITDSDDAESILSNDVSTGDSVIVSGGTHTFTAGAVDLPDRVTLIGTGDATFKSADSLSTPLALLELTDPTDVTISGLDFDLNRTGAAAARAVLVDNGIQVRIVGNKVYNGPSVPSVHLFDGGSQSVSEGEAPTVANNWFWDIDPNGDIPAIAVNGTNNDYSTIAFNRIGNENGKCGKAINTSCGNLDIHGNTIQYINDIGINITGSDNGGKNTVENNTINHCNTGIKVVGNYLSKIRSNEIGVIDQHGIILDDVDCGLVANNDLWNCGIAADNTYDAIQLTNGEGATENVGVHGNGAQMRLGSSSLDVRYAINETSGVSGNRIRNNFTVTSRGFSLNSAATSLNDII